MKKNETYTKTMNQLLISNSSFSKVSAKPFLINRLRIELIDR